MDEILCVVDKENAVEVVDFVLEYLCEEAATTAFKGRTVEGARTHGDAFVPIGGAVDSAHRETPFIGA